VGIVLGPLGSLLGAEGGDSAIFIFTSFRLTKMKTGLSEAGDDQNDPLKCQTFI